MSGCVSDFADELARALRNTPNLPRAACRSRGVLFDPSEGQEPPTVVRERHALAAQLCAACPEFAPCAEWAATLPHGAVRGIVAGRLHGTSTRRAQRQATAS